MPKRTDIKKIAIIGAGPIVIGQACEFDYSGTQACRALKEEGYRIVLINSNPATIMTDPETADRTYVEPITPEVVAEVLRKERPDALLPTLGGQTALNTAFQVADMGVLKELGIEMIGADRDMINRAEDREAFRDAVRSVGVDLPRSGLAHTQEEARAVLETVGLPCIVRPAFTLGGRGGGMAYNREEFERIVSEGLRASLVTEVLIEESVERWKELEVELMADSAGNRLVVCTIENFDPMGVHTGDSIAVAPIHTMTDRELQRLRDESCAVMEAIGLRTCGCNIQFAQNPADGRLVAIELNPRVSRSSALASKATGYPIARIAAKVAVGFTLPELRNEVIRTSGTSFYEPAIDYVVVKTPRFAFEKFPGADDTVTIQMKSVGETMAIGGNFKEALQKSLRSLEMGRAGLGADGKDPDPDLLTKDVLRAKLSRPNRERIFYLRHALQDGMTIEEINAITGIDPWWLDQIAQILETEKAIAGRIPSDFTPGEWRRFKADGFSDVQIAHLTGSTQATVRALRRAAGVEPGFRPVDTCLGATRAERPYFYARFGAEDESRADSGKEKILILGGGPNRIGQGIEFDYCCCHAAYAAHDLGYESVIINCNPETVSTDFDTSDRLYFEPLTLEDVLAVVEREKPKGVIVQFGGQTPLNISRALVEAGVPILGTSVDSIDRASDRGQFAALLKKLGLRQTDNDIATTLEGALAVATRIGYPVLARPSFVLGGAKMQIIHDEGGLKKYWRELLIYCTQADVVIDDRRPVLIDKFLDNAVEVDVDAISDGKSVYIAGVMEHIEEAGVHSGDSACSLPSHTLLPGVVAELEDATRLLAVELGVRGLMNVQYALRDGQVYVLEVNPRASRTVPFVSKVTGVPVARLATRAMLGDTLETLELGGSAPRPEYYGIKEAVFPFARFPGCDATLGPEMKSTGEVMGIDPDFDIAFAKSQLGAGSKLPIAGTAFITLRSEYHDRAPELAKQLHDLGFNLLATAGTAKAIRQHDLPVRQIPKVAEGHPNILDLMKDNSVHLIINTPSGRSGLGTDAHIRSEAISRGVPLVTTLPAAKAFVAAIQKCKSGAPMGVMALQDYYGGRDTK